MQSFSLGFAGSGYLVGEFETYEELLRGHEGSFTGVDFQKHEPGILQWRSVWGVTARAQLVEEPAHFPTKEKKRHLPCIGGLQ